MRRDPAFEAEQTAFLPSLTGSGILIPAAPDTCFALKSLTLTSTGPAAIADFSVNGVVFASLAVAASGSSTLPISKELPSGSGLDVFTSAAADVGASYTLVDHTAGITKEAARAASYQAALLFPRAIRTPNRFGTQTEG